MCGAAAQLVMQQRCLNDIHRIVTWIEGRKYHKSQGKHWILLTAQRRGSDLPQGRLCCLDAEHSSGQDAQKVCHKDLPAKMPVFSATECSANCCIYS